MTLALTDDSAVTGVDDADLLILARRGQFAAIKVEGDVVDGISVALDAGDALTGANIPQNNLNDNEKACVTNAWHNQTQ